MGGVLLALHASVHFREELHTSTSYIGVWSHMGESPVHAVPISLQVAANHQLSIDTLLGPL